MAFEYTQYMIFQGSLSLTGGCKS